MAAYDLEPVALDVAGMRFAIVASRFNRHVVEPLLAGAVASFAEHGVGESDLQVIQVPGAFEIPLAAHRAAASGRYVAVVTLGAVVRGGTPHFAYVAGQCADGVSRAALDTGVPVIFGVLTVDDVDQALARAGGSEGNKGAEAALAAMEMAGVMRRLDRP